MTVKEFLIKTKVHIDDNANLHGNNLTSELARFNIVIDFNKNINEVSDEEIYQIGRHILLAENPMRPFFKNQIIDHVKNLIDEKSNND